MRDLLGIDAARGITVVRVMMGLVFAVHGYQKFSSGVGAVVASFTKMGIPLLKSPARSSPAPNSSAGSASSSAC
jgi:uncharacterized membrane protein YphA (DoxX/SURF4 family)